MSTAGWFVVWYSYLLSVDIINYYYYYYNYRLVCILYNNPYISIL